jgi:NADH-quinone oxidoreductase subunit G
LADASGARLAWVPRRAGERGAVDAGCLPNLLPGGRPVGDAAARVDLSAAWGTGDLPIEPGRDTSTILTAAGLGELGALVVGGVEVADLPDPAAARVALANAPFVISLELRPSEVTEHASVVLPVAAVAEKAGTFVDWEGRERPFEKALENADTQSDLWVLAGIADELRRPLGFTTVEGARQELVELGAWDDTRAAPPRRGPAESVLPRDGQAVLATWHQLLDQGRLQEGEPYLAGTARPAHARLSASTAADLGVAEGQGVAVSDGRGTITLPLEIADLPDRVVWLPTNSAGSALRDQLGVDTGTVVTVAAAPDEAGTPAETGVPAGTGTAPEGSTA